MCHKSEVLFSRYNLGLHINSPGLSNSTRNADFGANVWNLIWRLGMFMLSCINPFHFTFNFISTLCISLKLNFREPPPCCCVPLATYSKTKQIPQIFVYRSLVCLIMCLRKWRGSFRGEGGMRGTLYKWSHTY